MLFNSYSFLFFFLPVVLLGWWLIRPITLRLIFLTLASYLFYGWWSWKFVPLMIASTTMDYIAGKKIAASEIESIRRKWLIYSLSFNLAILGFFKYYGFVARSINTVTGDLGIPALLPLWNIVLPIGISFYTFNSMSYTIDIYRRRVRPACSAVHFSAFVAMFPHLVAGPIVRYSDVEDQLNRPKLSLPLEQASRGIYFFSIGLAKKVLIADYLARFVESFFSGAQPQGAASAWLGVLSYTFQIYFDFSGYSDMAVGLAHLLGIQFPQNFNSPYKAANISDFWHRWHMSLSFWFRDYLFIPLGGSRGGRATAVRNLAITMFLGGLWHGASWTFVVWGLYHGFLLAVYHTIKDRDWGILAKAGRPFTFVVVVIGWVFFRSNSFGQAGRILRMMFGGMGIGSIHLPVASVALVVVAALIAFCMPNSWEIRIEPKPRYAWACSIVLVAAILCMQAGSPFLYYQF